MKQILILLVLVVLFQFSCGTRLLVHKTFLNNEYIVGRDTVVNIEIFNVGNEAAYDVTFHDRNYDNEYFESVIGFPSASWQKLAPGSSISHSFVVRPVKDGVIAGGAVDVTYKSDVLGTPELVRHVDAYHYRIVKFSDILLKESPHLLEWGIFAVLAAIPISLPFFSWAIYQLSYSNGIRKGSKLDEAIKNNKRMRKSK